MSVAATECPFIDSVYVSEASDSTPPFTEDISEQLLQTHDVTAKDWRKAQLQDMSLSFLIKCLEAGLPAPSRGSLDQSADAKYIKEWDKMLLSNRVLHKKVTLNGQNFLQLSSHQFEDVFEALHDDLGHQGRDRTMSLIKQRFFWPGMDTYIKNKVASCERCIRRKAGPDRSKLVNITSTIAMEIVCLDYLTLERSKEGFEKNIQITFLGMPKLFPLGMKQQKQQRGCCSTTSLSIMVSQPSFIVIKVPTSNQT